MVDLLSSTAMRGHQNKDKEKVPISDGDGGSSSNGNSNIVISKTGARIKLSGPNTDTWSHGERYKRNGWSCAYCPAKKSSGGEDGDGDDAGGNESGGGNTCGEAATRLGGGASGSSSARGGERQRSGVRIGRPSCSIRPRSTRKRKPTLKSITEL